MSLVSSRKNSVFACLFAALLVMLASCTGNAGKERLCRTLYGQYDALIQAVLDGEAPLALTATLSRRENAVTLAVSAPDPFVGMTVVADESVASPLFCIEYEGVRAEVPKETLGILADVLAFFETDFAHIVEQTGASAFGTYEGDAYSGFEDATVGEVAVDVYGVPATVRYDKNTGVPISMETDGITIRIERFKPLAA